MFLNWSFSNLNKLPKTVKKKKKAKTFSITNQDKRQTQKRNLEEKKRQYKTRKVI